jgi:dihydrofolate reductase
MQPLRYSINVTLDGCIDHQVPMAQDPDLHRYAGEILARNDALIFGRVTYGLMGAWRPVTPGVWPEWVTDWMLPFAKTIDAAKKYVVSSTLESVDWNSELVRGDLGETVRRLKQQPGRGLYVGGVQVPLALAELGLIDEYEFMVRPYIAGRGPRLFDGLSKVADLTLVGRREFSSGTVALRYVPRA